MRKCSGCRQKNMWSDVRILQLRVLRREANRRKKI